MQDAFVGTWKLNPERCEFDPNHRPTSGTLVFARDAQGQYVMNAEGTDAKGQKVAEPNPREIHGQVKREDGSIVGEATYVVSEDGKSLTATAAGFDSQLRRFETRTVWERH